MRIILTGGGTGGHIYPAVAIGQAIQKKWPEAEILYIGTRVGLENKIIPETGFSMALIDVVGWQRKLSLQAVEAGWKAVKSLFTCRKILRDFSPQIVIGTGGYVCLPVVWAASRLHITTLLHEQNAMPGLTNKFLSARVDKVLLTFREANQYFSSKVQGKLQVTGLPVRPAILKMTRADGLAYFGLSPAKLTIVGVGGSRGAKSINKAMLFLCEKFAGDSRVQIIHLTGQNGFEDFQEGLRQAGIDIANHGNIIIKHYLHEMEYAFACADVCIGRGGAAFLAEMTVKGIPGILIPYPYAAENHQEYNIRALVEQGAAEMILDHELTGESLLKVLEKVLFDKTKREKMARSSAVAGKPMALENIMQIMEKYVSNTEKDLKAKV